MNIKNDHKDLPDWYRYFCARVMTFRAGARKKRNEVRYLYGYVDALVMALAISDREGEVLHAAIENAREYRGSRP